MGPYSLKASGAKKTDPPRPDQKPSWLWLLVTAPGRLITFQSPHSVAEIEHRLKKQKPLVVAATPYRFMIRLPTQRTERRFFAWLEADPADSGRSQLSGQTRTPTRVALTRLTISLVLFWLALFWFTTAHLWLGVLFACGCAGFLLLAQYERLTERDLRLYTLWLRQVADAEPIPRNR